MSSCGENFNAVSQGPFRNILDDGEKASTHEGTAARRESARIMAATEFKGDDILIVKRSCSCKELPVPSLKFGKLIRRREKNEREDTPS